MQTGPCLVTCLPFSCLEQPNFAVDICHVCEGSTGNNEAATAGKRGNKRGHSALKQDSDSDWDVSDNYVPGSQSAGAAAAAAQAKK